MPLNTENDELEILELAYKIAKKELTDAMNEEQRDDRKILRLNARWFLAKTNLKLYKFRKT